MRLAIAGLKVELMLPDPTWKEALQLRLGAFQTEEAGPALPLRVLLAPIDESPGGDPRVEALGAGLWRLSHDQFMAKLGAEGGALWVHASDLSLPEDALHLVALDSALRIMVAEALAARGGLLMHAAGFAIEGKGFVAFGPSGAGKTTLCTLAQGQAEVLCDEVVAVAPSPTGYFLHSTPFFGAWGRSSPGHYPLGGMARLRHHHQHQWQSISPGRALGDMLESTIAYGAQAEVVSGRMDAATGIMAKLPVGELAFAPNPDVWGTIRKAIGA